MRTHIFLLLIVTLTTFAQTYTYDQLGRLIGVKYADGKELGYEYDSAGNILKVTRVAQVDDSTSSSVDDGDELTQGESQNEDTTLSKPANTGKKSGSAFDVTFVLLLILSFLPLFLKRYAINWKRKN